MARRLIAIVVLLAFVGGCGQSEPLTPDQMVHQGNYDEAIEVCTQLVRANPRNAEAYLIRGRAYHCRNEQGDVARAVADFSEAIHQDPMNSEAYYSRALAYKDLNDQEKAEADGKMARQLDPRLKELYAQLPEYTPPATRPAEEEAPAEAEADKTESAGSISLIKPPTEELQEYERLKRRFDPTAVGVPPEATPVDPTLELLKKPTYKFPSEDRDRDRERELAEEEGPPSSNVPLPGEVEPTAPAGRTQRGAPVTTAPPRGSVPPPSPWRSLNNLPVSASPLPPNVAPLPHSPFPQRAVSPTGHVERPASPFAQPQRSQPRPLYNSPQNSPQTVRPFGAYHSDYNP